MAAGDRRFDMALRAPPNAVTTMDRAVACVRGDPLRHRHELRPFLLTGLVACQLAGDGSRRTAAPWPARVPGSWHQGERRTPADLAVHARRADAEPVGGGGHADAIRTDAGAVGPRGRACGARWPVGESAIRARAGARGAG